MLPPNHSIPDNLPIPKLGVAFLYLEVKASLRPSSYLKLLVYP